MTTNQHMAGLSLNACQVGAQSTAQAHQINEARTDGDTPMSTTMTAASLRKMTGKPQVDLFTPAPEPYCSRYEPLAWRVRQRRERVPIDADLIRSIIRGHDGGCRWWSLVFEYKAARPEADISRLAKAMCVMFRRGYLIQHQIFIGSDTPATPDWQGYTHGYTLPGQRCMLPYSLMPGVQRPMKEAA